MFQQLSFAPPDPLLGLIDLFRADPRPDKIDLGVGVYRDAKGDTPVMEAVKQAEGHLLQNQVSKAYVGPAGDMGFVDALAALVFGAEIDRDRIAGVQTPGGTSALRLGADLLSILGASTVLLGVPGWPNHGPICDAAGLEPRTYTYFNAGRQELAVHALLEALESAPPGSAVLLQASCHNPTGTDLSLPDWVAVSDVVAKRGLLPFIDVAYQGFGDGLDGDVAGLRTLLGRAPEALVAVSCSKTFGLYRERTGALFVVGEDEKALQAARSHLLALARATYSMPPDHGAAVARLVMTTPVLRASWESELGEMRARIQQIRAQLADAAQEADLPLAALGGQHGMFSLLALSPGEVQRLRSDFGVHIAGSGRVNLAGLQVQQVGRLTEALHQVWRDASSRSRAPYRT